MLGSSLRVDEVRDAVSGVIAQHHIPSGMQCLIDALRKAFGQPDQDLATASLDRIFGLVRKAQASRECC